MNLSGARSAPLLLVLSLPRLLLAGNIPNYETKTGICAPYSSSVPFVTFCSSVLRNSEITFLPALLLDFRNIPNPALLLSPNIPIMF